MSAPIPNTAVPTVWFTKNINPTLHRVREVAQSGRYHVLASHVSPDASYLGEAHEAFLEPHPLEAERYPDYVLDVVRSRGVQAVIGGRYVSALAARRADFEALGCHLIVAGLSADSFDLCDDKARFYEVFAGRIPMPETVPVQSWDELEAAALELETRHGSACFKPARGVYGHGFRILTRGSELERFFGGDHIRISYEAAAMLLSGQELPPLLAMQTLPGKEYSVDALARNGTLLTCVSRRKVGGLGNVQMSLDAPELREWVALLASELQMDGLFNAQFKEDDTGQPRLLEVNARASGGLAISAALSGLKLGLLEVDAHFGAPLGDLDFVPGRRVTDAREVIMLGEYAPAQESALEPWLPEAVLEAVLPAGRLTITARSLSAWPLPELLDIGMRQNPRRPFLLVSRVLGKHLPTDPRLVQRAQQSLAELVAPALGGPWALIGMAETATALAEGVAEELSGLTPHSGLMATTTRYSLPGRPSLDLEETHSHAPQLRLYLPPAALPLSPITDLIFVDDEVTTGLTLARLAARLRAHLPALRRLHLVTLADFSSGACAVRLSESSGVPVGVYALAQGKLEFVPTPGWSATLPDVEARFAPAPHSDHPRGWRIVQPTPAPALSARPGEKLLILGSGEYMYRPYRAALHLAAQGAEVSFMATTRSPALRCGPLGPRLDFTDAYGEGTPNYLYDPQPQRYDRVLLLHETPGAPVLPGDWPNLTSIRLGQA